MAQTIAEKILSRQNLEGVPVHAGDLIDARVDGLMYHASGRYPLPLTEAYKKIGFNDGPPIVFDPSRVYFMNDHCQPPPAFAGAQACYESKQIAKRLGISNFYESEMGICHQMMLDYGHVRPGEFVVGNDSHAIMWGAINSVATGVGNDEGTYVWTLGHLFFTVPETIKLVLKGKARPYPFGKDIILYLAGKYGDSFAQGLAIEFTGPLADEMDMATRLTLADHSVEVGAKFGLFLADKKTDDYVKARTEVAYEPVFPDRDASYVNEIEVDCDELDFQVAKPFRFDNVSPVKDVVGVKIHQARIGSCANGRFEDIEIAARMLKGKKVAKGVRFYISPASINVSRECIEAGIISTLFDAGVQVIDPGCAICTTLYLLNEEVCISSTTRNHHGRFGGSNCADAQIYLAGPATVTASAIAGEIVDPREVLDD